VCVFFYVSSHFKILTRSALLRLFVCYYYCRQVRNPLSAAIAASSFVTAAVDKIILNNAVQRGEERTHLLLSVPPSEDNDDDVHTVQAIREDMIIVDQSLHFINDLLKSMLDMHKAASSQIRLAFDKLSVRDDVFLPVQGMLYQRDETFEIQIVCPADLVIVGDRLRLQQIVMNLARNATKFVQRGFISLRATVVVDSKTNNSHVMLYVEDSGPGIPLDKRSNLFQRFQESLDSLNQGTGVGLYLCKKLVDLMQGQIYLDESFDP
jgi:signal transduction histidine kinase